MVISSNHTSIATDKVKHINTKTPKHLKLTPFVLILEPITQTFPRFLTCLVTFSGIMERKGNGMNPLNSTP